MKRPIAVCVVGSGTRFLSGISVYTYRLTNALSSKHRSSAILMRQLVPRRFYPGRDRVGNKLDGLRFEHRVSAYDGVDWYWVPTLARAIWFLTRQRPEVVIFQWWSGSVFHSYLALALVARFIGARIVIEFHEVIDTGEARLTLARWYVRIVAPLVLRLARAFTFHSEADRVAVANRYGIARQSTAIVPHGPYGHYRTLAAGRVWRDAPAAACNILYFGVIRPFKGVEDLITAFNRIPAEKIDEFWLTIVGETWEGWTLPGSLVRSSRYRDRITFVNRYVSDEEVGALFAGADAVALPYHRSAMSGPLHVAMGCGLPVVVTGVGGLIESVEGYGGAIIVPPHDSIALSIALRNVAKFRGTTFSHPGSWAQTVAIYDDLFGAILGKRR